MRILWIIAGIIALGLGLLGIPLPLLPTVPFLLLATFCFARSSDRLHRWLVTHPKLGPPIRDWETSGAISRRAKILASTMMVASLGLTLALKLSAEMFAVHAMVIAGVALFIWSRPEA